MMSPDVIDTILGGRLTCTKKFLLNFCKLTVKKQKTVLNTRMNPNRRRLHSCKHFIIIGLDLKTNDNLHVNLGLLEICIYYAWLNIVLKNIKLKVGTPVCQRRS